MFLNFKTQSKKYNLCPQRAYNHSNDRERERESWKNLSKCWH